MRLLITGANGYVGARLFADLKKNFEVHGTYHEHVSTELLKGDITNRADTKSVIDRVKPAFIVHAAALVGQKLCEDNPELAHRVNVEGTENVALGAEGVGAKVIHMSTGAVLNPDQNGIYGKTKLEAEKILANTTDNYVILRAGTIIGSSPQQREDSFQSQLLASITNKTQAMYDDVYRRQITWIGYIPEIISEIAKKNTNKEILPIVTEENKTNYEIARDVLKNFGITVIAKKEREPVERKFQSINKLRELGMPIYSYQEVINRTVQDIKRWLAHKQ